MEGALILFALVIAIGLGVRLIAGAFDHDRIRRYIASRGGRVMHSRWAPFGPGWFGEKSDRIYSVRYADREGHLHDAHCKTSLWTGVYFTADHIVKYSANAAPAIATMESLADENRRLRAELERLRNDRRA